ncbi:hypothetical protein TNCV_3611491 [Trichonephila clavipes]|nr:hypothetical protein TNCV_3611491 [Trichonephila clavipes]
MAPCRKIQSNYKHMRSHIQGDLSAGQLAKQVAPDWRWRILTFSKTSRIRTGFLTEQFWQTEMMRLRSSMSPFRSSFQGENMPTESIDCIFNDNEAVQYPIEFLNSIQTPDL